MSFLCSTPTPTTVEQTSTTTPRTPTGLSGAQDLLLNKAVDISNLPYQQYTGNRQADLNGDQTGAFDITRGATNAFAPNLANANQATANAGRQFSAENISPYLNPFQQAVTDANSAKLIRNFKSTTKPSIDASAVGAGSFGGSRHALLESEAQRNLGDLLSNQQSQDSYANWQQAQQAFNADRQASLGAGAQYGSLAEESQTLPLRSAAALSAIGGQQQQQQQGGLDIGYSDFLRQQQFPRDNTTFLQGVTQGFPTASSTNSTQQVPGSSPLSQAAGLGLSSLGFLGGTGAFGANGWGAPFMKSIGLGAKAGGPVKRYASGGKVGLESLLKSIVDKHGGLGEYASGGKIRRFDAGGSPDTTGYGDPSTGDVSRDDQTISGDWQDSNNQGQAYTDFTEESMGGLRDDALTEYGDRLTERWGNTSPFKDYDHARSLSIDPRGLGERIYDWGAEKIDRFANDPAAGIVNGGLSAIAPPLGALNTVSGWLGGPKLGDAVSQEGTRRQDAGLFNASNRGPAPEIGGEPKGIMGDYPESSQGGEDTSYGRHVQGLQALIAPSTAAASPTPDDPAARQRMRYAPDPLLGANAGSRPEHLYFYKEGGQVRRFAEGGPPNTWLDTDEYVRNRALIQKAIRDSKKKPIDTYTPEWMLPSNGVGQGRPGDVSDLAATLAIPPASTQIPATLPVPQTVTASPQGGRKTLPLPPPSRPEQGSDMSVAQQVAPDEDPFYHAPNDTPVPTKEVVDSKGGFNWEKMALPIIMAGAKMAEAGPGKSLIQNIGSGITQGTETYLGQKKSDREDRLTKVEEQKAATQEEARKNDVIYKSTMSKIAEREVAIKEMPVGSPQYLKEMATINELNQRAGWYASRPEQVETVANLRVAAAERAAELRAATAGENSDTGLWKNAVSEATKYAGQLSANGTNLSPEQIIEHARKLYGAYKAGPSASAAPPRTATGPDGKKIQWNGTAWVPLQ